MEHEIEALRFVPIEALKLFDHRGQLALQLLLESQTFLAWDLAECFESTQRFEGTQGLERPKRFERIQSF